MSRTAIGVALGLALATSATATAGDEPPKPSPQETAYLEYHCDRKAVICYNRNGQLFAYQQAKDKVTVADSLPEEVDAGDTVTVVVLTEDKDDEKIISVTFQGKKSQETAFDDALRPKPGRFRDDGRPETEGFLGIAFPSEAVADDVFDLTIVFRRPAIPVKDSIEWRQTIPVYHGYSYYSVALLVAATFKGDRHVLRDLDTTADHAVDPGLALNVFPFGRERGRIGYIRTCRRGRIGRCLADMIGFQLATDLDLRDPTDKLYTGLVFEPVAGLGLSGGVSLRKVAVVPSPGALPATEAMTGPAPTDTRYVMRGYVAVTMTFDLLDTISSMGTKIRTVKLPE